VHLVEIVVQLALPTDGEHLPTEDLACDIWCTKRAAGSSLDREITIRGKPLYSSVVGDHSDRLKQETALGRVRVRAGYAGNVSSSSV
jgi:hypothetical protein